MYTVGAATISKKNKTALVAIEAIASRIVVLRGERVMLDSDLAALYGVTIKRLNEQVKRNLARFPSDFTFQLTREEWGFLRSQFATLEAGRGQHRKYRPYAFTEHGAIMAAMVLNSPRATEVSVYVVRAFVELRDTLIAHKELAKRLDELESRLERKLSGHDQAIAGILDAIRQLMVPPEPTKKRRIGFVQND
jgi:phage regulator Rha-like protein